MPSRNPELPEGTDHIVNGAMETGTGGTGTTTGGGRGSSSGFIGGGDTSVLGDDTGGTAFGGGGDLATTGGSGSGAGAGSAKDQLKSGVSSLKGQATDKVRAYAEDGKTRATSALSEFSHVMNETAESIDERLGEQYGRYARQAATAVSDFADSLRQKEVDEIYDNAREFVRKSPAVAIGAAAAVGFALVRLIKSGIPEDQGGTTTTGAGDTTTTTGTGTTGSTASGSGTTGSSGTTGTGGITGAGV